MIEWLPWIILCVGLAGVGLGFLWARNIPTRDRYITLINQLLQISALAIGATWAWWTWNQSSAPSLLTGLETKGELKSEWSRTSAACWGSFTITVDNVGQKRIAIDHAEYRVQRAAPERMENNNALKIVDKRAVEWEETRRFTSPYVTDIKLAPKDSVQATVYFLLHPDDKKQYWFKARLFGPAREQLGEHEAMLEACEDKPDRGAPTSRMPSKRQPKKGS